MYPHFIEVHNKYDSPVSVNIENITHFSIDEDGETWINLTDGYCLITESYDEVKQLIIDAGCQITKADPRLDTAHPLTMKDLHEMIGEPVWNSNTLKWYLTGSELQDGIHFTDSNGHGYKADADMLSRYPLYRMKQD